MHPNLRAAIAAGVLLSAAVSAAVTGEWQVNLLRSSTKIETIKGSSEGEAWAACIKRIPALADGLYKCQSPVYVARKTADPTPTCPPLPPAETRSQSCPSGSTGAWSQTRSYTAAAHPTCAIAGEWLPTSPPAGACTVTPPPPSGDTIRHGQPFTITGSGFGSKPSAGPLVFDDFDACTAGAAVAGKAAVAGRWNTGSFSSGVTCAEHDKHKVARHEFTTSRYNASLYVDPTPTQTVLLDFWIKGVPIANPSRNWKSWRFYSSSDSEIGNSVYYCLGGGVDLGPSWVWKDEVPPPREWLHYQVIQKPGLLRHTRNGKVDLSSNVTSGIPTVAQVRIGHYWGTDGVDNCANNPGGNVYTDDVYVDTSIARVELRGTGNKYAIQRATGWVNDAVAIVGNTRGFTAGEAAQLIVIDAGNVQRKAQQVTIQ